jgi:hypothetical protein
MRNQLRLLPVIALLLLAAVQAPDPARADPIYTLLTTIAIPSDSANTVGGKFTSFDISWFDGSTQLDYVADRSNASVDVFSAATNSFVTRIGSFVGIQPGSGTSGPNGVVTASFGGNHQLWAGDGPSLLYGFNLNAGNAALPGTPIATGTPADKRVDEMAFSPLAKRLIVANDDAATPFITIINTKTDAITHQVKFDGIQAPLATGGLEQPVWDPHTKRFYMSVPEINGTGAGAIVAINPWSGKVTHTFDLSALGIGACGPTGLALGIGNQMMIGCGTAGSQAILFDPTLNGGKGGIIKTFSQVSGSDEVWFDPVTKRFFVSGANNPGGAVLGVIDGANDVFLQDISTVTGAHSVAVDEVTGEIFVPFGANASNTICPNGCIAVFGLATQVAEPGSMPTMLGALTLFAACLAWQRRREP